MWKRAFSLAVVSALVFLAPAFLAAQEEGSETKAECQLEPTDATTTAQGLINEAREAATPDEAERKYQRALAAVRADVEAERPVGLILAAMAHVGLGQYETADELLDRFIALKPACGEPVRTTRYNAWVDLYNEAIRAYQAGDIERALERFEFANRIHTDIRSLNNAAFLHEQQGETERAIELYRRATTAGGEPEQVRNALGSLSDLLMAEGRLDEAAEVYEPYLAEHPEDTVIRVRYAVALAEAGRREEATPIFEEVLSAENLTSAQWNEVGVGLFNADQYENAVEAFRRAHEANPYNKESLENLVTAQIQADLPGEAAGLAPELIERYPYEAQLYQLAANALANVDRDREALQMIQAAEDLPLLFESVRLLEGGGGTYVIRGSVQAGSAGPGSSFTVPFELIGRDGGVIAAGELQIELPVAGRSTGFELALQADEEVAGFRYRKAGASGG